MMIDAHVHLAPDDPQGDALVRRMDNWAVEKAILLGWPEDIDGRFAGNDKILAAAKAHKGRLVPFAFAQMRESVDVICGLIADGFAGLKIIPNFGDVPDWPCFDKFWETVATARLTVLTHCGWLLDIGAYYSRLTSPLHWENPVREHPEIKFIFAHFGGLNSYLETLLMLTRTPNCYADLTPGQGPWPFEKRMPGLEDCPGDRVLFGSDTLDGDYPALVRRIEAAIAPYPKLTKQGIFHDNAARLFP